MVTVQAERAVAIAVPIAMIPVSLPASLGAHLPRGPCPNGAPVHEARATIDRCQHIVANASCSGPAGSGANVHDPAVLGRLEQVREALVQVLGLQAEPMLPDL